MLQLNVQFDQNLNLFWYLNRQNFINNLFKKRHRIERWLREHMFFDLCLFTIPFCVNFGCKMGGVLVLKAAPKALPCLYSTPRVVWTSPGTILQPIWHEFWVQNGGVLVLKAAPKAFPCLYSSPRVVWTSPGTILEALGPPGA